MGREGGHCARMIRVTYHDRDQAAPVVTFRGVRFEAEQPVEVADDWAGVEQLRTHPHFTVGSGHAEKAKIVKTDHPEVKAISIGEARAAGREAFASDHHRRAPAHFSPAQKKAWLEGFDRARRKAKR